MVGELDSGSKEALKANFRNLNSILSRMRENEDMQVAIEELSGVYPIFALRSLPCAARQRW
jgi:hypothetical protein